MKIKNFCASKDIIKEENEKTTYRRKKIFTNHITDKNLISRLYKEFLKLNNKKITHFKN